MDNEQGLQSNLLVNSPVYMQAVEDVRADLYTKWVNSDFADSVNREQLYTMKIALELITSRLDGYIVQVETQEETNAEEGNNDEQDSWKM